MARENYRYTVGILRRVEDGNSGGGNVETYREAGTTTAFVRDEKYDITMADQGAPLTEVKIFSFRKRTILPDDLLRWHGDTYEIVHIDEYDHRGREIRVRGRRTRAHWSLAPLPAPDPEPQETQDAGEGNG